MRSTAKAIFRFVSLPLLSSSITFLEHFVTSCILVTFFIGQAATVLIYFTGNEDIYNKVVAYHNLEYNEARVEFKDMNIDALDAAMRVYNGKPMVNSVSGKQESMDAVFPLVKKYGGVVVGLTLDENGIPESDISKMTDEEFEEYLTKQGFPESYKVKLICLLSPFFYYGIFYL